MSTEQTKIVKVCECCKSDFSCNAQDIKNCFCYTIQLNEEIQSLISKKYKDCLCEDCLLKLSNNEI